MISDRFRKRLLLMVLSLLLAGCMTTQERLLDMDTSQVQLRSIQSRIFDTTDKEKTMRAIIATLQDLGFMLDRVDYTLGVVTASKARSDVLSAIGSLRMTVTVRQRGEKQLLVRANIEYQLSPVTVPKPYQNFFNSLEKAMFLEAHQVD
ncbi:MAG: hypothetical protein A4E63_00902 [Syntrophorhabdus sp. PtaU1.Bin050]|nr:MAG: hypothetical protein A4E63_00902 [Syntrophorhabdus sp. PtaU1.Bin050]